jgi:hypothetical protein
VNNSLGLVNTNKRSVAPQNVAAFVCLFVYLFPVGCRIRNTTTNGKDDWKQLHEQVSQYGRIRRSVAPLNIAPCSWVPP